MGDTKTFGGKVPEDLHNELSALQKKLGLTGEAFFNELLSAYKTEKAKDEIPEVAQDFKELQILTNRINNIYLNLGYRINTLSEESEKEKQELLSKKEDTILDLQNKNVELENKNDTLANAYNDIVNDKELLNTRVNELTESNENFKTLNEEYKSKFDTMAGIVEEYKGFKTENEELKLKLAESQAEISDVKRELQSDNIQIENLKEKVTELTAKKDAEIISLKENQKNTIEELKNKHINEIETLKDKTAIDKDKAILELNKHNQQEQQDLQNKHNKEIEEYQNRIKEILGELENVKKTSVKTTHSKNAKSVSKNEGE